MRIDTQTLRDLEILGTSSRAPGLVDVLCRTRTTGGREAFRRRLVRPLDSVQAIRETQDLLRHIAANRRAFDALPTETQMGALVHYLDSRYATVHTTGPGRAFRCWWVRVRDPDLYLAARRGVHLVHAFVARATMLADALADAPGAAAIVEEMRARLATPPVAQHREPLRIATPVRTLTRDHAARETGRAALRRLIELIFEIDALVSMSDVTAERGFAFPTVSAAYSGVELRNVVHPFLERPVANNLALPPGTRLLFLTGPNMAGKTTYLKACGMAVLLAHAGMGVPAQEARVALFDRMISAIRTEDDLREGVSYFQAEARRVREMAHVLASGARCMILVDELFRGTNVKDACEASLTVLRTFAGARNGRFLVASHLIELADGLEPVPGVLLSRFEADVRGADVAFDFRIRAGVSSQRLGMLVLEKEGVLDVLASIRSESKGSRTA